MVNVNRASMALIFAGGVAGFLMACATIMSQDRAHASTVPDAVTASEPHTVTTPQPIRR